LICALYNNHLPRLPIGPSDLGDVSFVHPDHEPPAILMVRGNIALNLYSFGEEPVELNPYAYQLDTRVTEKPTTESSTHELSLSADWTAERRVWRIKYSEPSELVGECYYKFFATGGELSLTSEGLCFKPREEAGDTVEGFAIAPGRVPYWGELMLPGDAPDSKRNN